MLRPPNVYGLGDGNGLLSLLRMVASSPGAVPYAEGTADHLWSFVHVEDLADLFVLALTKAARGELFHAGTQSGLRTRSIAEAISLASGHEGRTVEVPIEDLRSQFSVAALADYWATNNQSSRNKAETLLDWRPRHLDCLGEIAEPHPTA